MAEKGTNVLYAQSGGVTAVINATAGGVIDAVRDHRPPFGRVYAAKNGVLGVLENRLFNTDLLSSNQVDALRYTPGGTFGSCRYQLPKNFGKSSDAQKFIRTLRDHGIGYFFYNGGGDSQDTAWKIARFAQESGFLLTTIGLPKTVDNDLEGTDNCPGFGSVAKYIATSTREIALDVMSMSRSSTKVFVLEVMGRNAGWIAAASGLAAIGDFKAPHVILFPEIPFDERVVMQRVQFCVEHTGYCMVVVAEGVRGHDGRPLTDALAPRDSFGHIQLGGAGMLTSDAIKTKLGYKCRYANADYLQCSARHIASKVDVEQAYQLGFQAVERALAGSTNIMMTIERVSNHPYRWQCGEIALDKVANLEKKLPMDFISEDGLAITTKCRDYLLPLIQGEDHPPYQDGLPMYLCTNPLDCSLQHS